MKMPIDRTVYPDMDVPPDSLDSPLEKADYVHRICAAWDFGVHPEQRTFALFGEWRDIFDQFPIVTSPAYHAFRAWFRWPAVEVPEGILAPTPRWEHLDRLEGRGPDPCEEMI